MKTQDNLTVKLASSYQTVIGLQTVLFSNNDDFKQLHKHHTDK